jgi:hypothetical protein
MRKNENQLILLKWTSILKLEILKFVQKNGIQTLFVTKQNFFC